MRRRGCWGRLGSQQGSLRTLGTKRTGERGRVRPRGAPQPAQRGGVQLTGCQFTYLYCNFCHSRSTSVYYARWISVIFFHLALGHLKTTILQQQHSAVHVLSSGLDDTLMFHVGSSPQGVYSLSRSAVLCNGKKERTVQGRT